MFVGIQALADFQQVKIYQEMGFMSGECFTLGWLHWLLLMFLGPSAETVQLFAKYLVLVLQPGWLRKTRMDLSSSSFKLYTETVWLLLYRQKSCPCHKYGNYWERELTLPWLQRSREHLPALASSLQYSHTLKLRRAASAYRSLKLGVRGSEQHGTFGLTILLIKGHWAPKSLSYF